MADAAVEFLLNNLKELLLYHSHLITDMKEKIEILENDLRLFNAFLKDSLKRRRKDESTKALMHNIRNVVYELEDIIDTFVTKAGEKRHSRFIKPLKPVLDLHEIGIKIENVKEQIERARTEIARLRAEDTDTDAKPEIRHPREKGVVGFEDVTEELIGHLTKETGCLEVISLIGMFGLGKTTLAWKIFNDPDIIYKFPVRIWLSISQEFSDKEIFLSILKQIATVDEETRGQDERGIARKVASRLKEEGNFLIVMDDVWKPEDWNRLRVAIPEDHRKGKVLITSRIVDVGNYASTPKLCKNLRFFTEDESWELLRLEALRTLKCPPELETVGRRIAKDCDRLPLAIVIIGGILAAKYSGLDTSSMRRGWEEVSTQVRTYIKESDMGNRLNKFISLSYDVLPYHLRACFLYLGMFPEDYKIPVYKLIQMWIGEGFIQEENGRTLEATAEMYLKDLINRNLVTVEKFKADGKMKTCRVHDVLRDFSREEAENENGNFLKEIKYIKGKFVPPVSEIHKYRHLSIHSNCLDFIASQPSGPRVRSFVCFAKEGFTLSLDNAADILKAFKLVRVLDVKPIKFTKITNDIYQLVHARYIALSLVDLNVLPSKLSKLWNIQTLIVETTSRTLKANADIWELTRLRHFKTNVAATLPKPSKKSKHGVELQTLGTISVESCTAELLEWACNLNKLAMCGRLETLLEGKIVSNGILGKMKYLEKLKLVNDAYPRPASEDKLSRLPQPHEFPSNLKSLTLVATNLEWKFMSVLALLQNLEVLKLNSSAFVGSTWEAGGGGFPRLEFLQIDETDLCVWVASSHTFPILKDLVLKNCENLGEIPIGLADAASLRKMELLYCSSAAASAKRIEANKKSTQAEGSAFKLSIFPATD